MRRRDFIKALGSRPCTRRRRVRACASWRTARCRAAVKPLSRPCHQCVISRLKYEEESMSEVDGATLIARSLKQQGIDHLFGGVGFPVTPIASPFCKFAHGIESVQRIPYYVEMATRNAIYGRPGATYLDVPDDIITGKCDVDKIVQVERAPDPPRMVAPMENIEAALNLLQRADRPLVLIGKGMAWSRAEDEVRAFIERTQLPFLRSPMGKGVMPDDHPLSVAAARRPAPQKPALSFPFATRMNWIFHFGPAPRYAKDV